MTINLSKTKTYFYSTGIERVNTTDLKDKWVNYSTNKVYELSSFEQQELQSKIQDLQTALAQLKKQICLQALKLKNRNRG